MENNEESKDLFSNISEGFIEWLESNKKENWIFEVWAQFLRACSNNPGAPVLQKAIMQFIEFMQTYEVTDLILIVNARDSSLNPLVDVNICWLKGTPDLRNLSTMEKERIFRASTMALRKKLGL